jgi:hypothetical protein
MNRALLVRFAVSATLGAVMAVGTAVVVAKPKIDSTAPTNPVSITGLDGNPLEFELQPGAPKALEAPPLTSTIQLTSFHAGATAAPGGGIAEPWWKDTVPRIPAVTQFDGGPLAAVNCLMAAGAMLARLGYGIVTTGSQMRALQADQEGGTNYGQLQDAVRQGWKVRFFSGALTPLQLRALLYAGAGAVIDGVYGEIPDDVRLQKSFTGRHAVYVDAFRPQTATEEAAYFVIDPIGKSWRGYKGLWWPADDVERFAAQLQGGRIASLWAFPGGVVPKDHPILPPNGYPGADKTPGPGTTPDGSPGTSPGASPAETPFVDPMPPGDLPLPEGPDDGDPPDDVPHPRDFDFHVDVFEIKEPDVGECLKDPKPLGCPRGITGIVDIGGLGLFATSPPKLDLKLLYASAIAPGTYQVLIESPPDSRTDLWFWGENGTKLQAATVETALFEGKEVAVATITLDEAADFSFVATSTGDGTRSTSSVGTLKVTE